MTPQDKLNRSARAHGWANWSEVLMHNAPPHVINLIVEEAMRGEPENAVRDDNKYFKRPLVTDAEPCLTWRPGARVRITRKSNHRLFDIDEIVTVVYNVSGCKMWMCYNDAKYQSVHESDAVVVG